MIHHLKGDITEREEDYVVIDVNGVGYKVFVSSETQLSGKVMLFCFMHYTGKDVKLYGFKEKENLAFFKDLMKISGIGPKAALQLASIAPMDEFKEAVKREDKDVIKKVLKIGRKKGERVIFEVARRQIKIEKDDAFEALKGLGFETKDIDAVLEQIPKDKDKEEKVKEALKLLDKR